MNSSHKSLSHRLLISALMLELAAPTLTVATNILVDGSSCTLENAILAANTDTVQVGCPAGNGHDVIELPENDMIQLSQALPLIEADVTINGNGTTVHRDDKADEFAVLVIDSYSIVNLNKITISGGQVGPQNLGAGVVAKSGSAVHINESKVIDNHGGAVWLYNVADSTITNSLIQGNTGNINSVYYTGGISINAGKLTIANSTITGNSNESSMSGGGGLYLTDFSGDLNVEVYNSTITGNSSTQSGGGVSVVSFNDELEFYMTSSSVVFNQSMDRAGGLFIDGGFNQLVMSLITGNEAVNDGDQLLTLSFGDVYSFENLFGSDSISGVINVSNSTFVVPVETVPEILQLDLSYNGGLTPTHALVDTGPGVDGVQTWRCLGLLDQTGKTRPIQITNSSTMQCDFGAYEAPSIIFKNSFE